MSELHIFNSNKEYQDNEKLNTSEFFDIVVESKIQSAAEAKIQSVTEAKILAIAQAKRQASETKKQAMAEMQREKIAQTRTEIEDFFRRLEKGELKHKKESL